MKKLFVFALVALLATSAWAEGLSVSQKADNLLFQGRYIDNQIVVKYADNALVSMDANATSMNNLGNNTYCLKLAW